MRKALTWAFAIGLLMVAAVDTSAMGRQQTGLASIYADALKGRRMANGQLYDPAKLIAAHKTLPLGTRIRVANMKNRKTIVLRVVDRGPCHRARILDLSRAAASQLGLPRRGVHKVTLEVVENDILPEAQRHLTTTSVAAESP